jgi:hypothetical protein
MKFTELPRPAKTLILFCIDAVLAIGAYWIAAIARFGRLPAASLEHAMIERCARGEVNNLRAVSGGAIH